MYRKIEKCRICGNAHLTCVLDLGEQMLTGVFPKSRNAPSTVGPLRLVKCVGGAEACGLLQLEHSFDLNEMYGDNYGYRSGLNSSMVTHLQRKISKIVSNIQLRPGDLVIDIGSNDSTTLQAYPTMGLTLVGIDPTCEKFKEYYPTHIRGIPDFFSASLVSQYFPSQKARVITSFSMFYDLESPVDFMKEIESVLADDGIWVFEQSYMPAMLSTNSFDTVCHEHLEFYALRQIKWMTDRVGLRILDVEFNDVNGGSFSVTVGKAQSDNIDSQEVRDILDKEVSLGLNSLQPYQEFAKHAEHSRSQFLEFCKNAKAEGKSVAALGASTKGNVLLQYYGLSGDEITAIGEVNPEKYGSFTPGTWIPIISESSLLEAKPDYLVILPWHFKEFFLRQKAFIGTTLVFPLPSLEVISR